MPTNPNTDRATASPRIETREPNKVLVSAVAFGMAAMALFHEQTVDLISAVFREVGP